MNLNDFESIVEPDVLSEGREFFSGGHVTSISFDGTFLTGAVDDDRNFTVRVHLSKAGELIRIHCNCPIGFRTCCAHQAAVYFALKEWGFYETSPDHERKKEKESRSSLQLLGRDMDASPESEEMRILQLRTIEYCESHPGAIRAFYMTLLPERMGEVTDLFEKLVRWTSRVHFRNRDDYRHVCRIIGEFRTVCGNDAAETVCEELKKKHKNKKAFLEELQKVLD